MARRRMITIDQKSGNGEVCTLDRSFKFGTITVSKCSTGWSNPDWKFTRLKCWHLVRIPARSAGEQSMKHRLWTESQRCVYKKYRQILPKILSNHQAKCWLLLFLRSKITFRSLQYTRVDKSEENCASEKNSPVVEKPHLRFTCLRTSRCSSFTVLVLARVSVEYGVVSDQWEESGITWCCALLHQDIPLAYIENFEVCCTLPNTTLKCIGT